MPLIKGKKSTTKKGVSENIRREIKSGKKPKQAIAIALSTKKQASKKLLSKKK